MSPSSFSQAHRGIGPCRSANERSEARWVGWRLRSSPGFVEPRFWTQAAWIWVLMFFNSNWRPAHRAPARDRRSRRRPWQPSGTRFRDAAWLRTTRVGHRSSVPDASASSARVGENRWAFLKSPLLPRRAGHFMILDCGRTRRVPRLYQLPARRFLRSRGSPLRRACEAVRRRERFHGRGRDRAGCDFGEVIEAAVDVADVFLAVIGRRWLSVEDGRGSRRLDKPEDLVRMEIEAALRPGVRLIPVRVGDAEIPTSDELPPSLAPLARRMRSDPRCELAL